jgi:uncharacterized hydrophobic protein (TIGR00271 family)
MANEAPQGNLAGAWASLCEKISSALGIPVGSHPLIYGDILEDSGWKRPYYWICLLSSCGIATLGLAQNSPAVIIGAMLLSPLMSPIVGLGLALALGDVFLGIRSLVNCLISIASVVGLAALIAMVLPFKEITPEILSRTRPNPLDLFIALFCGLVAAVSVAKSHEKGSGAALPGVAIAVALVPPLCVAGWGLGTGFQWNIFLGAMVLFLTNLTAIVFLSLLVFLALGMGRPAETPAIRGVLEGYEKRGAISAWVQSHPWIERFRRLGGIQSRILIVAVSVVILFIPLNSGLRQVKRELFVNSEVKKAIPDYLGAYTILSRRVTPTADGATINLTLVSDRNPPAGAIASMESYLKGRLGPRVTIDYTEVAKGTYAAAPLPLAAPSPQEELRKVISQVHSGALWDWKTLWPERSGFTLADLSLVVPLAKSPPRIRVRYVADEPVPPAVLEAFRLSILRASEMDSLDIEAERIPRLWGELDLRRSSNPAALSAWAEQIKARSVSLPPGLGLRASLRYPADLSPEKVATYEQAAKKALASLGKEPLVEDLAAPNDAVATPVAGTTACTLILEVERISK